MFKQVTAAATAMILTACGGHPSSYEAIVRTYDLAGPVIHVMILDPKKVQFSGDFPDLAKDFCKDRKINGCFVWMYIDAANAPLEGQGGETAKKDPIFVMVSNWGSKLPDKMMWACDQFPQSDQDNCLGLSRGGSR